MTQGKTSRRRPAFLTRDEFCDRWDATFNRNESAMPVEPKDDPPETPPPPEETP